MKLKTVFQQAKKKIFTRYVFFVSLVVFILVSVFYGFQLIPAQQNLLKEKIIDRGKTISEISAPIILKAIDTKDDIIMLTQINTIMKLDDIYTVYIMDNDGKIIAHDKPGEWGKIYLDEISTKATKFKTPSIHRTKTPKDGYIYAHPLIMQERIGTFIVGISNERTKEKYFAMLQNNIYSAIPTFLLSVILLSLFVYKSLVLPVQKFEKVLSSISLGKSNEKICSYGQDEIGEIACRINNIIDKLHNEIVSAQTEAETIKERMQTFINELCRHFSDGIIVTDRNDKIVFINKKAAASISVDENEAVSKHILDLTNNIDFVDLVKKALDNPNQLIEDTLSSINKTTRIVSINTEENELIGLIIVFL